MRHPKAVCVGYAQAMPNEDDISHEETSDPLVADARNFYKVEKWTGQVYELLDILTGFASFEGRVLRPTIVSYS
jgi:hypothetical protein